MMNTSMLQYRLLPRTGVLAMVLLSLCLPLPSSAQSSEDGSIYSRFGVGARSAFNSSKSLMMGGAGVALKSVDYTNHLNPASLNDQILTRFAGGFTLEGVTATAMDAEKSRLTSGYLNALQLSFPLMAGRLGLGFNFEPYSKIGYRVEKGGTAVVDPEEGTQEAYTTRFSGNGGIQRLSGGFGVLLVRGLSIGLRADLLFGILEQTQQTHFLNSTLRDGNVVASTRLHGATATFGLRYVYHGLLKENDQLSFGAAYTMPVTLKGEQVLTTGKTETADTLGQVLRGNVHLPVFAAVGLAYQPSARWTVIADVEHEPWSSFRSDLPLPGYEMGVTDGFENRTRISGGIEFFPGATETRPNFFERLVFRVGAYSDPSYVSPDPEHTIKSYGFTGGISIPSRSIGTSIDINLEVGRRGTTDYGLINDNFLRFGVNLNFGERWFDRARLL